MFSSFPGQSSLGAPSPPKVSRFSSAVRWILFYMIEFEVLDLRMTSGGPVLGVCCEDCDSHKEDLVVNAKPSKSIVPVMSQEMDPKSEALVWRVVVMMRQWRLERNWSQQRLASEAGVALATLRVFERTGRVSLTRLVRMLAAMECLDKIGTILQEMPAGARVLGRARTKKVSSGS